jgi:hypothetical protein
MKKVSTFSLLVARCFPCALALLFSCQFDDAENPVTENPVTEICKHMEMNITDPDDPINLVIDFDDDGRATSLHGSSDGGEKLDLVLEYDSDGLLDNVLSEDVGIVMDDSTKEVQIITIGNMKSGPAQEYGFRDHRIWSSYVINGDKQGVETTTYTYDDDGNATSVEAHLIDENENVLGNYFVEFTYDSTHEAVFANAPFLQAYTTFSAYLLPFGLTTKNLITSIIITFGFLDQVAVETRDFSYTFNDEGRVTSMVWSNKGGEFETEFTYDCN